MYCLRHGERSLCMEFIQAKGFCVIGFKVIYFLPELNMFLRIMSVLMGYSPTRDTGHVFVHS
jgi:hypothetical protein